MVLLSASIAESSWTVRWRFLLFMIMGAGANWVLATALMLEIPYFENHQPEGLCVATYMNAANNLGIVAVATYLFIHNNWMKIPYYFSVPALLVMSVVGAFLSAAVYNITVSRVSLLLYLCSAIGGCIGALSYIIFNPFMTQYKNLYITGARVGGSAYILLCALISIAQDPGTSHPRFSVSVYMSIFGALLIPPIFAYRYISQNRIGLRGTASSTVEPSFAANPLTNKVEATDPITAGGGDLSRSPSLISGTTLEDPINEDETMSKGGDDEVLCSCGRSTLDGWMGRMTQWLVSDAYHAAHPWLRATIPYMITVAWVDFNTWGIMTAMVPFAMSNADVSSSATGSESLAIAYQVGSVTLVLGDLSTAFFKLPKFHSTLVYTVGLFVMYASALGAKVFRTKSAAPLLIIVFGLLRFIEAHLITSSYRAVATEFPPKYRQIASRNVGTADQVFTTLGAVLSTLVVSLLYTCSAEDNEADDITAR